MLKDTIIAILAGIAIAQRITPSGDPARAAIALITAVLAFMILLELEDLWDKRRQITQRTRNIITAVPKGLHNILRHTGSRIRWYLIGLRTWPIETAQRRRRRQMMRDYIQRLRDMRMEQNDRPRRPEESEV